MIHRSLGRCCIILHFKNMPIQSSDIHEHIRRWHCKYSAVHEWKFTSVCGVFQEFLDRMAIRDKAFTFGYSQKAAEAGRNSNQSPPAHFHHPLSSELLIHLWTEILCFFSFLSHCKLLVENWIWCPGAGWKIGQNSLFPPIEQFATLCNEWQNKISVGDAILCWVAGLAI